jgi:Ca2+-binding RTX toxin-like protein
VLTTALKSTGVAEDNAALVGGALDSDVALPDGTASAATTEALPSGVVSDATAQSQADSSLIHLDQFRADPRFSGIDGHGLSVAVIDTGIDLTHPFFGNRIVYSYDFSDGNDSNASDTVGHGSNVASIIGSQDGTYTGMARGVNIIALKVFPDGSNSALNSDIAEALDWVVANRSAYNIVAVNLSLGVADSNSNSPLSSPYSSQFATLAANNTAVVVASGNSYSPSGVQSQGVSSPSSDPNAWSIGAVWDRDAGGPYNWWDGATDFSTGPDRIISFSQRSASMTTVFAPGGQITGANWNGGTVAYSGTSQATPHVAGLVADMQQLALQVSGHFLSVSQLKQDMIAGSVSIFDGDDENDNVANTLTSYHRVDALGWGIQVLTDLFAGTAGNDTLNGTPAAESIHGGLGNDTLGGNGGNDLLDGGRGDDTLAGGSGSDTFVFGPGYGSDTITDFAHAEGDKIDLTDILNVHSVSDITSAAREVGADAVLNFGCGDALTVRSVDKSAFGPADFAFNGLIESVGSIGLDQVRTNYFLYALGSASGVPLRYFGAPITSGQFGDWAPLAAEQAAGGYQVAWYSRDSDQYILWSTDSTGNWLSNPPAVMGNDPGLQSAETSFQQDLNGDGRIGLAAPSATVIEMAGSTSLVQIEDKFFLYPIGGSSGPELRYFGAPVAAGQFGDWTPLGVEQSSSGYQVAWQSKASDQYILWSTDSTGNWLSNPPAVMGNDPGLQSAETSFQQDLNGDGRIGPAAPSTTVIEAAGSTTLVQVRDNFFFYPIGGSSGPELRYFGAPVAAGQFGDWTPLGVEQSSSGYQVAWQSKASDQYILWSTDSTGNWLSNPPAVMGNDPGLQSAETSFQQDLNGDGTIGSSTGVATGYDTSFSLSLPVAGTAVSDDALALLTSYMSSTFVTPAGAGAVALPQQGYEPEFLTKPAA